MLLLVAPKVGIISLVAIAASMEVASIRVTSKIQHFQAVEGDPEISYLVAFILHMLCVFKICHYVKSCWDRQKQKEGAFFAIFAFSAALYQIPAYLFMSRSKETYYQLMNEVRLVPWIEDTGSDLS